MNVLLFIEPYDIRKYCIELLNTNRIKYRIVYLQFNYTYYIIKYWKGKYEIQYLYD